MQNRFPRTLQTLVALGLAVSAASCGGSGASGSADLVLVSFNLPNIAGVALNQPLIYTFSDNVDPTSVTPDTLQVNGSPSFTFETIVVDGNLVAELPFIPNFEDYSDSGLAPNTTYTVFLPIFPAVDTVRSTTGHPLVIAESFSFTTNPVVTFLEPRRPITHAPGPFAVPPGKGDDDGCLQNPDNSLYVAPGIQFGSGPDARLLCLKNEGPPHVLLETSVPTNDQRAVGTPSATAPGTIDMPAIITQFNEPLDPVSVIPYIPSTQLSLNVQLWHVGDTDANAIVPQQIRTNKPLVVQNLDQTEVILVAVGPQPQGTYLVNIQGCKDLPGNPLVTSDTPNPVPGGYGTINAGLTGIVPPGYRIYFRTLELPSTGGSVTESFGNNAAEVTDNLFTRTNTGTGNLVEAIPSSPATGAAGFTMVQTEPGQSTDANWNGAYRYLGLSSMQVNNNVDDGAGRLKAVFEPYLGNGDDGNFVLSSGSGTLTSAGGDFNNDGVYEFQDFTIGAGATLTLAGPKPVLLLIRGTCTINGTVQGNGSIGGFGLDTDGTVKYTNPLAVLDSGPGGVGGPGGGSGGHGSPQGGVNFPGDAGPGIGGNNVFGTVLVGGSGSAGAVGDTSNQGGGGGGFGTAGSGGSGAANGAAFGSADFTLALASFSPQRCYQPSANLSGGAGGGGGGLEDDNGTSETGNGTITVTAGGQLAGGDDGGGGGGGAGGGLWIMAKAITIGATGKITMNGARGGNTYGPADQVVFDPNPMNSNDEYVTGVVNENAAGTGQGGGGGGGSGGAILLEVRDSLSIASGAVLQCNGGAAGTTGSGKNGGVGGSGRIGFLGFALTSEAAAATMTVSGGATITPAPGIQAVSWKPTVDMTSQGVSKWIDLVTATATFSTPFWTDNFGLLTGQGLTQGPPPTNDFNAIVEFQGADSLLPNSTSPTSATGLTAWVSTVAPLNNKLFVRWRWRFFVNRADANVANNPDFDQTVNQMPAILDFTLPFQK